jgi:hypothetical protein
MDRLKVSAANRAHVLVGSSVSSSVCYRAGPVGAMGKYRREAISIIASRHTYIHLTDSIPCMSSYSQS